MIGGSLAVLAWLAVRYTGELVPTGTVESVLVVGTLLFVVLGTLVLERHFTGPGDAFVNSLSALVVIFPLRSTQSSAVWWLLFSYLALIASAALTAVLLQRSQHERPRGAMLIRLQAICYRISTHLGKARFVYSVVFVVVVSVFAETESPLAIALIVFWAVQVAAWMVDIPDLVAQLTARVDVPDVVVGVLDRVDSPYLARISISDRAAWDRDIEVPVLIALPNGATCWALRLAAASTAEGTWGTALLCVAGPTDKSSSAGLVTRPADGVPHRASVLQGLVPEGADTIVGVVREGTTPGVLRVEILPDSGVKLGDAVAAMTPFGPAYYQIADAITSEEPFGTLRYGTHVVSAPLIGALDAYGRLDRTEWLPMMGSLVCTVSALGAESSTELDAFVLGAIPGTTMKLTGDFVSNLESHTAILGATGSGKTEFAFDLIRHALSRDVKVICIDLTSQYGPRLSDCSPHLLTISDAKARDLGDKLFDVETGSYGAGSEKKVLKAAAVDLRTEIETSLGTFLKSPGGTLGLIELREISNTKATLWITEMYLSTLLNIAKSNPLNSKVLVVVEEAHTVMPEASFLGLGDFDSKGTVAKITQLALQGRKYGVGLLVLAQRTATVSKSVLTQCNTVISFACIDDTSIGFLRNVYGSTTAESLPNLRRLRAVAHGAWIDSGLPVVFDVPFAEDKAARSTWAGQVANGAAAQNFPPAPVPAAARPGLKP